jgi:hypothetical protein
VQAEIDAQKRIDKPDIFTPKPIWTTICPAIPSGMKSDEFGAMQYALKIGCKNEVTVFEQVFAGGMAAQFTKTCDMPLSSDSRSVLKSYVTSQLLVTGIGPDYGAPDVGEAVNAQLKSQMAWAAGAKAAEKIGCGRLAEEMMGNLVKYINSTTGEGKGPSRFVQGCVAHYDGYLGYNTQKCQCVADIGRAVFPQIHVSAFEPDTFKRIIKASPLLALQIMGKCKATDY